MRKLTALAALALAVTGVSAAVGPQGPPPRDAAAAVSFAPPTPGQGAAWGRAVASIEEAARRGARYVVLPEQGLGGPPGGDSTGGWAALAEPEPIPGPTTRFFGRIAQAHGLWLVLGLAERAEDGIGHYVTTVVLDEHGEIRFRRRRVAAGADGEALRGDPHAILETVSDGARRIGVLSGGDLREGLPRLAARGADVVLVSAAWPRGGAAVDRAELAAALSRRHGVPVVVADRGGAGTVGRAAWRSGEVEAPEAGEGLRLVELAAPAAAAADPPPLGLPPVPQPAGRPATPQTVALGEQLFFDPGLSRTGEVSCASCHRPELAFSNGERVGRGVDGRLTRRNVPGLLNVAYRGALFWDGRASSLENQAKYPISDAAEMDFHYLDAAVDYVRRSSRHATAFRRAFGDDEIDFDRLAEALAAYQRTLLSGGSAFDRAFFGGERTAMSPAATRGFELFVDRAGCVECHRIERDHALFLDQQFHNTGVGYDPATGRYGDPGLGLVSSRNGLFLTPSLRDVASTAPYMHDGSLATLEDVVRFYDRGGVPNPNLDPRIRPLGLGQRDVADLVAFLHALSGGEAAATGSRRGGRIAVLEPQAPAPSLRELASQAAEAGADLAVLPAQPQSWWPAELAASGDPIAALSELAAESRLWLAAVVGERVLLVDAAGDVAADQEVLGSRRFGSRGAQASRAFRDLRAVETPFGRLGVIAGDDVSAGMPRLAELGAVAVLVSGAWEAGDVFGERQRARELSRQLGVEVAAAGATAAPAALPAASRAGGHRSPPRLDLVELPPPPQVAVPLGLPSPPRPAMAPRDPGWVEVGRRLFFDPRLSADGTVSCATCHDPQLAFADGRRVAVGVGGRAGHRNVPSLINSVYKPFLFWDGTVRTLEDQVAHALEGWSEMDSRAADAVAMVAADSEYRAAFSRLIGDGDIELVHIVRAVAAFERTIVSGASAFDRYRYGGEDGALGPAEKRGLALFTGKAACAECHTVGERHALFTDDRFHNTGVGYHPRFDYLGYGGDGLESNVARDNQFRGEYLTPTLRDIAATAPYMHDGSLPDLAAVVDFYDRGGIANPFLDPAMRPLGLSAEEKRDLVAFLKSLSGEPPATSGAAAVLQAASGAERGTE